MTTENLDKPLTNQDKPPKPKDDTPSTQKDTPKVEKPSLGKKEPSPEQEPKTLTAVEAERLAQLARMDAGRAQTVAETERDGFKVQNETLTTQVEQLNQSIKELEARIDDLTSDDPKRFEAVKELREAKAERITLKADRKTLEADKQANVAMVATANDTIREIAIWEISANYEGGDPVKLKDLCDIFGAKSQEDISKVADTLWPKKPKTPETQPLVPFSGRTGGGVGFIPDAKNPSETLKHGFRDTKN